MKAILFPYPYKLHVDGELMDGAFFPVPSFCRHSCSSKECRNFYHKEVASIGHKKCPYGFGVDVVKVGDQTVIFTCLDVEKISDKKMVMKRSREKDYIPRIPYDTYIRSKEAIISLVNANSDFYNKESEFEKIKKGYEEKIVMLDDTFHELRKLNQQLKPASERLIYELDVFDGSDIKPIDYYTRQLHATSQLISIRLSTYDLSITNDFSSYERRGLIAIYKKFDKVKRLLEEQARKKDINIIFSGESHSTCEANDIIELVPYLLLDNAIKYSMWGKNIFVNFEDGIGHLIVTVKSFSHRPNVKDLPHLRERGYRSKENSQGITGKGIGLYLADLICINSDVSMDISLGDKVLDDISGCHYSDFIVKLDFSNIISG